MKKTFKKILCTVLVIILCMTSIPLDLMLINTGAVSADAYNVEVVVDVEDYFSGWVINAYNGYVFYDLFGKNNPYEWQADIVVSCVNKDGTRESQVIDILNGTNESKYTLNFILDFYPASVTLDFYYLSEFNTELFGNLGPHGGMKTLGLDVTIRDSENKLLENVTKNFKTEEAINLLDLGKVRYDVADYGYDTGEVDLHTGTYELVLIPTGDSSDDSSSNDPTTHFPVGYNFETDGWNFINQTLEYNLDKYIAIHGPVAGTFLYETAALAAAFESSYVGEKGSCFGMATTTGYIMNGDLSISNLYNGSVQASHMSDARNGEHGTVSWDISELNMPVSDFIQYAHLTQYSGDLVVENLFNKNDIERLIQAVKDYVDGGESIVISYDDHTVFPYGWEENKETGMFTIFVDDSNSNSSEAGRTSSSILIFNRNSQDVFWSGTSGYTSANSSITFCHAPSYFKSYLNPTAGLQSNYVTFISGKKAHDISNTIYEIITTNGNHETNLSSLYCIEKGRSINFKSQDEDNIVITDRESAIEFKVYKNTLVDVVVDDSNNNSLTISNCDTIDFNFISSSDSELLKLTVQGTAPTSEFTALQTENGLLVDGISDGIVTLIKDEEVIATQEIKDAVSDVEITYDKTGLSEDVELKYHVHSYTSETTTPATHLTEGVETFNCDCGDSYTETVAKLEGHTYTSKITKEATHLEEGETTYTCDCGDTYTETIEKIAEHTHEAIVTNPTCTAQGYTTYTCACGDSYVADYVNALGHTYETVVTVPTCTSQGYTTYICDCGDSYKSDLVDVIDHEDADNDYLCDDCGAELYKDSDNSQDNTENCSHICHKTGFLGFFAKIAIFFWKLFGINPVCECGMAHY